jgi:hypothetical protein
MVYIQLLQQPTNAKHNHERNVRWFFETRTSQNAGAAAAAAAAAAANTVVSCGLTNWSSTTVPNAQSSCWQSTYVSSAVQAKKDPKSPKHVRECLVMPTIPLYPCESNAYESELSIRYSKCSRFKLNHDPHTASEQKPRDSYGNDIPSSYYRKLIYGRKSTTQRNQYYYYWRVINVSSCRRSPSSRSQAPRQWEWRTRTSHYHQDKKDPAWAQLLFKPYCQIAWAG